MKKKIISVLLGITLILDVGYNTAYAKPIENKTIQSIDSNLSKEILDNKQFEKNFIENWKNIKVVPDEDLYKSTGIALGKPGDILIATTDFTNTDINAILLGSITTHAAMVDADPTKVLESYITDGVQRRVNDWKTRYKKVLVVRVKANDNTIQGAINSAANKINCPFNFILWEKTRTDRYYCSQLVWRSYLEQNIDLDRNGGQCVFPLDLISDKTTIVYKQGY